MFVDDDDFVLSSWQYFNNINTASIFYKTSRKKIWHEGEITTKKNKKISSSNNTLNSTEENVN